MQKIDDLINVTIINIEKKATEHPKWIDDDKILDKLEVIYHGNVGDSYKEEDLAAIYKEGQKRYTELIPPGYKDRNKEHSAYPNQQYGDLIIWKQVIDFANKTKKPIVFITDDTKEDWWWRDNSGKTIGPRWELKKEMLNLTGSDFLLYTPSRFHEYASTHFFQKKESSNVIDEINNISERNKYVHFVKSIDDITDRLPNDFEDNYPDNEPDLIELFEKEDLKKYIEKNLSIYLTDREQMVLKLRYGLHDGISRTLEEVAMVYDVTRERIKQIEIGALKKLRKGNLSDLSFLL